MSTPPSTEQVSAPAQDGFDELIHAPVRLRLCAALDHARDYFTELRFSPTDLDRTTVPVFFTRQVTHFCAPRFADLKARRREAWLSYL